MKISGTLTGLNELRDTLASLESTVYRKAAKESMNDASKLILAAARAKVPERTKSLRRALGRKVKPLKSGTGYFGVVGPRKDNKRKIAASERDVAAGKRKTAIQVRFRRTVKIQDREILVDPVRYAHLVEFGRGKVQTAKKVMSDGATVFGKRAKGVAPRPFLRPAYDETRAAVEMIVKAKMREATREACRTRKGKR